MTTVDDAIGEPRVIRLPGGQFLARTQHDKPLRLGAVSDTRETAVEQLRVAVERVQRYAALPPPDPERYEWLKAHHGDGSTRTDILELMDEMEAAQDIAQP